MPYTSVSGGTGYTFRDTRTLPYAGWGGECQSERAPAWRENALWSCVLNSSRQRCSSDSEAEWENEGIRGRRKADHRGQWNQERDELTRYLRVTTNNKNWALNQFSWQGKHDCSANSRIQEECHFVKEFVNFERRSNNDRPNVKQRYLEVLVSCVAGRRDEESCKIRIGWPRAIKIRCWQWSCSEMQVMSVALSKSAKVVHWLDCPCHPRPWRWEYEKLLLCSIGKVCSSSHWMSMHSFTTTHSKECRE